MPTWPSGTKAGTTNVDNPNDLVANARADIKQNIDNVNDIIDTFNISSPSDGDLLRYSSSSGLWEQVASTSVGSAADFAIIRTTSSDADNELISGSDYKRGFAQTFDPNGVTTIDNSAGLSNTFTLGAGNYIFEVFDSGIVFLHRLHNDTDDTDLGIIVNANQIDPGQGYSFGERFVTISSSKTFSLRVTSSTEGDRTGSFRVKITKF